MITLLTGSNTYESRAFIDGLSKQYDTHGITRRDGSELSENDVPELLQGASLFADKRLVIIRNASSNKSLWAELANWLQNIPDETHLILLEPSPDKRTKTYKMLQKLAETKELKVLNEYEAAKWLGEYAKKQKTDIAHNIAMHLIDRIGTDQWQLQYELDKLLLLGDLSKQRIDDVVEAAPQANVFTLIDAALQGRKNTISIQIKILETQEDPYRLFGLLASQVFQLVAIQNANNSSVDDIAKDLHMHPYPLKKLKPLADQLSKREVSRMVDSVASLDLQMKRSAGDPWLLLERALIQIATS